MKFLLVLLVVLVAIWLWRGARKERLRRSGDPGKSSPSAPQDMVRCPVCDLYLPRSQAISGPEGDYCCQEHRLRAGGQQ